MFLLTNECVPFLGGFYIALACMSVLHVCVARQKPCAIRNKFQLAKNVKIIPSALAWDLVSE